jgi:hypothetical protein
MEDLEEQNLLSESCETYVLENEVLISAFPGYIVFGKTEINKRYCKESCLKFKSFEVKYLFKSIIAIIAFLNNEQISQKTEKIIDAEENKTYYWQGATVSKENIITKLVKIAVEKEGETIFRAIFFLKDINCLVYLVKRCLVASLCLKDEDEEFILTVIKHSRSEILSCKLDENVSRQIVKAFLKDKKNEKTAKQKPLMELLKYYNQLILLIKDLDDLYYFNDNST